VLCCSTSGFPLSSLVSHARIDPALLLQRDNAIGSILSFIDNHVYIASMRVPACDNF